MPKKGEIPTRLFLKPVRTWFQQHVGKPNEIQLKAWPLIARGESTLLLAPTGSGKTLAAFLACLDRIWRSPTPDAGVRILYISPLKALNNDIQRNLSIPLAGVIQEAEKQHTPLRTIRVGVRTGDTPPDQRRALSLRPPEILITTPESLHLLLTSSARETLRNVETVIVDEIHSLCPNKRGAFLSLLLERLESFRQGLPNANPSNIPKLQRIGLSATQKPLEEVARFLGGLDDSNPGIQNPSFRPVTLVDAGAKKGMDLEVTWPQDDLVAEPKTSIWPAIHQHVRELIQNHASTLVFANNRRSAEKITAGINENPEAPLAQAHHGSVSLEKRLSVEESLKQGQLKAVIATASLEMGIDMGQVNLVVQVESPGSVSSAIQRIGRAGHMVGQSSKGRLIAKTDLDLAECAALAPMILQADVEPLRVPTCPLDILAQQIVSAVAMEPWPARLLYRCLRQAYPYQNLASETFEEVLDMVSGGFQQAPREFLSASGNQSSPSTASMTALSAFQPKIHYDRVLGILEPLPGTKSIAISGGGAIPDTGNYAVIGPERSRVGELDEEFVYERRAGDAFLLGTTVWRIESIEPDRVLVSPAPGASAVLPFWRGEGPGRSLHVGKNLGIFLREAANKIDDANRLDWLEREHRLDRPGARNLFGFLTRQLVATGMVPHCSDILVEAWRDSLGDWQVVIINLLGGKFNHTLRLALEARYREIFGYLPVIAHHDDGVLIRLTDLEGRPENPLSLLKIEDLQDGILKSLTASPLFAVRFRQNAVRALMVQRGARGRRAPLWLQRLRGKDLLQVLGKIPGFPLVNETIRECLTDHLEMKALAEWLAEIRDGKIANHFRLADTPSPFAREITWQFTAANMYQPDEVRGTNELPQLDPEKLDNLLATKELTPSLPVHPDAVRQVDQFIRLSTRPPRSLSEMANWLNRLGDLSANECGGPIGAWIVELLERGSISRFLPSKDTPELFIPSNLLEQYQKAFHTGKSTHEERVRETTTILRRYLDNHALIRAETLCQRYPISPEWAQELLKDWAKSGDALAIPSPSIPGVLEYSAPENWKQVRQISLGIARREFTPVSPKAFSLFLLRWQQAEDPSANRAQDPIQSMVAKTAFDKWPLEIWEKGIAPSRIATLPPNWIDNWTGTGKGCWVAGRETGNRQIPFALVSYNQVSGLSAPAAENHSPAAAELLEKIRNRGASFGQDLLDQKNKQTEALTQTLLELTQAGMITNDRLGPLRDYQNQKKDGEGTAHPPNKRARLALLRAAYQLEQSTSDGRWSAVPWGNPTPEQETSLWAVALLDRFGVLCKGLAQQVTGSPPWKNLYQVLDQLEMAGEIRRGHFVEGLPPGAQFALPEALDMLSAISKTPASSPTCVVIHALDPANLYGPGRIFDFPEVAGVSTKNSFNSEAWVALLNGYPAAAAYRHGKRLDFFTQNEAEINLVLSALLKRLGTIAKPWFMVESCSSVAAGLSPWRNRLESLGMVADHLAMAYHRPNPTN